MSYITRIGRQKSGVRCRDSGRRNWVSDLRSGPPQLPLLTPSKPQPGVGIQVSGVGTLEPGIVSHTVLHREQERTRTNRSEQLVGVPCTTFVGFANKSGVRANRESGFGERDSGIGTQKSSSRCLDRAAPTQNRHRDFDRPQPGR